MSRKGRRFELDLCSTLSNWWTAGQVDSVFYHTHVSGARATVRGRKGKKTANSHGDVMALDPSGQPLLDVLTLEIKAGYSRCTVHDLLDKPSRGAKQEWEKWFDQAAASARDAGSMGWAVVARRDRRTPVVFLSKSVYRELDSAGFWVLELELLPRLVFCGGDHEALGVPLDLFLAGDPQTIRKLAAGHRAVRVMNTEG